MFIGIIGGIVIIVVLIILFRQISGKSLDLYEVNESREQDETSKNQLDDESVNTEITPNGNAALKHKIDTVSKFPYNIQENLFSQKESRFFEILGLALEEKYKIFTKVRVADVLYVDCEERNFYVYFNRIARKRFDFVICSNQYAVVAVVEFDDSENRANLKEPSQIRVDDICRIANLPLIKFDAKVDYSPEEIRGKLSDALERADSIY